MPIFLVGICPTIERLRLEIDRGGYLAVQFLNFLIAAVRLECELKRDVLGIKLCFPTF